MRLLLALLSLAVASISSSSDDDISPLAFNDELRDRIQKFQPTLGTKATVRQRHLVTMLARYARIHKHFVAMPNADPNRDSYRYRFPDPAPDFDPGVAAACSAGTDDDDIAMNCLEYMARAVVPKTNWANHSIDLLDTKLQESITDSAFSEVLTFVGIMCWATRNHLSFLEEISCADKFYTKDPNEGGFKWDGALNSIHVTEGLPLHGATKFYEDPFHCAELSFCPEPCKKSKRAGCQFERHLNIDLLGMIENRWNLTFPCPTNNQIYRPDLDICVHKDDCLYHACPANAECEEALPTSLCICSLGFAPDATGACKPIDLSSVSIPWTSPYAVDASARLGWTMGMALVFILR